VKTSHPRRRFLRSGLAGIFAAAVAPRFIPARLLGQNAPSKRTTLGFIGLGAHGLGVNLRSFLQQDDGVALALCDVQKSKRDAALAEVHKHYGNRDCTAHVDFREVLARRDLDAVVISTPDHWHVTMALMALEAGKHVFCEKPTLTIAEGRRLADAVKKGRLVFATGLEDRAVIQYHMMAEHVRNGAIGRLRHIACGLLIKDAVPREAPAPVPADLHYGLWLGPAPFRPYSPSLLHPQTWRQIRDFSGGTLTDWGAHMVDTAQVGNFAEDTSPVAVSGKGDIPPNAMNDVPRTFTIDYTYANGVTMQVTAGQPSVRFEGTEGWIGNKGWLGRVEASDPAILRRRYDPKTSKLGPLRPREQRDFLDCLKNGQPPLYTAEALHRLSTTLHIGALAMELGRPLKWDPVREEFPGDAAANALRTRAVRDDWRKA
jgi:predicted dehydrogenase